MPLTITVNVTGLDDAIAHNAEFAATLNDWTEALTGLGETLKAYYSDVSWVTNGAVWGKTWRALKPSTIKQKDSKSAVVGVSAAQPLIRTGAMKAGFRATVSPMSLYIDNEMDYWKYHQTGTGDQGNAVVPPDHPGRGKNLPQRVTAGIDEQVKSYITSAIGESIQAKIEATYGS